MLVSHAMSAPARTCRASTQLGQAARMMTVYNCGCLPVVDDGGHLIGVITDRDVSSTVAARHQNPWQLAVRDAMTKDVESCTADDPIERALEIFGLVGVRRLPVVDRAGHVKGVLSVDDLVLHAGKAGLSDEAVLSTLKSVCGAETGRVPER
jgi:CBS domain-containing protein